MKAVYRVKAPSDWKAWCRLARSLLARRILPSDILWERDVSEALLPSMGNEIRLEVSQGFIGPRLPDDFVASARRVFVHSDQNKWSLLYRTAWRLIHENPALMRIESDPDVHRLCRFEQQVRRDTYRMTQFVRFRKILHEGTDHFIAWHKPDHDVLAFAVPFFMKRFAELTWSILTPYRSAHWNGQVIEFGPGVDGRTDKTDDESESLWRIYYAAVSNPARLNPRAMTAQMPRRFWPTLPEAQEIGPLMAVARRQASDLLEAAPSMPTATAFLPADRTIQALGDAASRCQGCELHAPATQTVFGQGPTDAPMMLVGEQPGDEEDRGGSPFVGPAGTVLDRALRDAGLDRSRLYITNAVKHFRFQPVGRARRHQRPSASHIAACRPWLEAEIHSIQPRIIVCLGNTAARSLLGHSVRLMEQRGQCLSTPWARGLFLTIHPSAVLRAGDTASAERLYGLLVLDLTTAAEMIHSISHLPN